MDNDSNFKRQKRASEKSWSVIEEESKNSIIQMIHFQSHDDKHKERMKKVVEITPIQKSNKVYKQHGSVARDGCTSQQQQHTSSKTSEHTFSLQRNVTTSSTCQSLNTTTDVESFKKVYQEKKMKRTTEEKVSSKKKPIDRNDEEIDELVSGVLEKGEIDRMCLLALIETESIIGVCSHCGGDKYTCNNLQYGPHCIHSVLDYYEKVGINNFTDEGIEETYRNTYVVLKRHEIFQKTKRYEMRNHVLSLPKCMEDGSLCFSKRLLKMRKSFVHLISMRNYDNQDESITNIDENDKINDNE